MEEDVVTEEVFEKDLVDEEIFEDILVDEEIVVEDAEIHALIYDVGLSGLQLGLTLALVVAFLGFAINRAIKIMEDLALKH